jgi:hypothetical protein
MLSCSQPGRQAASRHRERPLLLSSHNLASISISSRLGMINPIDAADADAASKYHNGCTNVLPVRRILLKERNFGRRNSFVTSGKVSTKTD